MKPLMDVFGFVLIMSPLLLVLSFKIGFIVDTIIKDYKNNGVVLQEFNGLNISWACDACGRRHDKILTFCPYHFFYRRQIRPHQS